MDTTDSKLHANNAVESPTYYYCGIVAVEKILINILWRLSNISNIYFCDKIVLFAICEPFGLDGFCKLYAGYALIKGQL